MADVTELGLLTAWEAGVGRPAVERAVTLAALASGRSAGDVADLPLGECDRLLLALRERCFGPHLDGLADCPACGAGLDVRIDIDELRVAAEPSPRGEQVIDVAGTEIRLRPLTSRDVGACDGDRDRLLARCVVRTPRVPSGPDAPASPDAPGATDAPELPEIPESDLLKAIEASLDQLDPRAAVALALDCPGCGAAWQAPVDVTEFVWSEVDRFARRLLADVHALARAYGWTESDVFAVSPARRRCYLEACLA
ncbi:MAG: hypothetical protein ACLPKI_02390 [Streptosporangiaceae bacterium]